jgi:hypothetical protein
MRSNKGRERKQDKKYSLVEICELKNAEKFTYVVIDTDSSGEIINKYVQFKVTLLDTCNMDSCEDLRIVQIVDISKSILYNE